MISVFPQQAHRLRARQEIIQAYRKLQEKIHCREFILDIISVKPVWMVKHWEEALADG